MTDALFHSNEESLVVLGSLNAMKEDREMQRSEIIPLQIIVNGEIIPVPFFDSWGELGLSSMAWHPARPKILYMSTGNDLVRIDLARQIVTAFDIENLVDIHEMTVIDNTLWIANTGTDEAIAFDLELEKEVDRVVLSKLSHSHAKLDHKPSDKNEELIVVDKFHWNQVVEGFNKELFALVHHVTGKQLVKRIAESVEGTW
jgi:hypothetical protein